MTLEIPMPGTTGAGAIGTDASTHVAWMFELGVRDGCDAELRALMSDMVEATKRDELGALEYEWYVSDDGRRVHLFEIYADVDATMAHLATFGERYMRRFFGILIPERMTLYGDPGERVRAALARLAPAIMTHAAGFRREAVATAPR
jgi:quinol monooxygenase YgiN